MLVASNEMLTVGHGTLEAEAFASLVRAANVDEIVDVRRYPGSRRHPHFGREAMSQWLDAASVGYRWLPALGGRRSPTPGSPNVGLRNPQFRAYADHMASGEFADGVRELLALTGSKRVAVLCSESVWWRCHRRLLADHLVLVEHVDVRHLMHDGRISEHPVTDGAAVGKGVVTYLAGSASP